jgi:hypothetical protein
MGAHLAGADHTIAEQVVEGAIKPPGGLNLALIGTRLQGLGAGADRAGGQY